MDRPQAIGRLALIGVGLIGGSLARSLKQAGAVGEVVGAARTQATLRKALELGVIDRAENDLRAAAVDADLVVIATPMQAMPSVLSVLDACLDAAAVVTDVGSVKGYVVEAARRHLPRAFERFVPGHPIAGREHAGVEASTGDLFRGKTTILTPTERIDPWALATVSEMWQQTGAHIEILAPGVHDRLLASTSHLPHVVAYALVSHLAEHPESEQLFALAASGFYDFTRIASSDPVMWRDICLTNRDALAGTLRDYRDHIDRLLAAIEAGDGEALHTWFERAKRSRDRGLDRKSTASDKASNAGR